MSRVEEMTTARVAPSQAIRLLTTTRRFEQWVAPDITIVPLTQASMLGPGDRFRLEVLGGITFQYLVEAITDREVVFSLRGPWSGRERWSFVADGAETIIRRVHEVDGGSPAGLLAWGTVGRPLVMAHFKLELSRFRALAEREPGVRGEIRPTSETARDPPTAEPDAPASGDRTFPIDDV